MTDTGNKNSFCIVSRATFFWRAWTKTSEKNGWPTFVNCSSQHLQETGPCGAMAARWSSEPKVESSILSRDVRFFFPSQNSSLTPQKRGHQAPSSHYALPVFAYHVTANQSTNQSSKADKCGSRPHEQRRETV